MKGCINILFNIIFEYLKILPVNKLLLIFKIILTAITF